ncbi:hypothetical protein ACFVW8_03895 [Streptomyces sp. NPDC058221]|uniref:hypothetical protein n=1 Tax=Streptomyces sp. NPDC058221 TaxID=3346388 RepID=UPI0036E06CCB
MATNVVGTAAVEVLPSTENFHRRLAAAALPAATRVGQQAGDNFSDAFSRNVVIAIPDAVLRGGRAATRAAGSQGGDAGGAFARSIRRKLEAAFKAMPKLDIRLSDTGVDAQLNRLRARMETLRNKTIGVDVTTADAEREIIKIDAELKRLGAQHADVDVRADTATARAALAAIRADIAAVDGKDVDIDVKINTSGASSALMGLGIQILALTAIPLGPILAAGLGGVAAAATAAGAGVGALALVAIPAVKGISEALTAKKAAEDEATSATDRGAASNTSAARQALSAAGAQAALASAHRNAANAIVTANRQVETAERAVATAVQSAADARRNAAEAVERAERQLSDAQRSARQAEDDLTQARQTAAQQLRDLNDQLLDGMLDQREATLRVQQAQESLNEAIDRARTGKGSQLDIDAAQLALDRAKQGAKEQKQDYADLQKAADKQRKAGVEGSDAVTAAQARLSDAQRTVGDNTEALAKARQAADKAARDGAQGVADAQQRVTDAERQAAEARVSAAESVANAQRGLASAQLSSSTATAKSASAADKYKAALDKLTPAGRGLFNAIAGPNGLTTAFKAWSTSLQPAVLPLFTRMVNGAKAALPGLTPLVLGAASAIGVLQGKASGELKNPFWRGFKKDLTTSVKPAVVGLGVAFGNMLKGMAGVIGAFLPHMRGIASESDRITARFAKWGSSLKGSPQFEKFLTYVKSTGPGLAEFLGKIMTSMLDFSKAIAPLSTAMFAIVGPLFDAITWLSTNMPGLVQTLWTLYTVSKVVRLGMIAMGVATGVYSTIMALATLETFTFSAALATTGIGALIMVIVVAVAALVAGIIWAFKNVGWFHAAVMGAWSGIKVATLFLWGSVLKPTFDGIWTALKAVGAAATWLWVNALRPAFGFIAAAAKVLFTALVVILLTPAILTFKALGAIGKWLWKMALGPTFRGIGEAATWLWSKSFKPAFSAIGALAKWVYDKAIKPAMAGSKLALNGFAATARWLWSSVVKPVFGWIGDRADWLYQKGIKPAFDSIKAAMKLVSASFETGKKNIKKSWDAIKKIAADPVKWVVSHVYNDGLVKLWNKVAAVTGAKDLKPLKLDGYATGGIIPGYTPGVDNHLIAVGGGESILRPEVTRAVGASSIHALNHAARNGGVGAVQAAIANGTPAFANGGVVGNLWGGIKNVGNTIKNGVVDAAEFLTNPDKVFEKASSWVKDSMKQFANSKWGETVTKIPIAFIKQMANSILGFGGEDGSGVAASGGVGRALAWAKSQAGLPYQWAGGGNPSWDCSGYMAAIQKVILGQNPRGRLWSTHSFNGNTAPAGWVRNLRSPFMVGITNAGVGHTAGTLAGVNVESRGGRGVVVGRQARGWNDRLFTSHYGFKPAIKVPQPKGYAQGGFPVPGDWSIVGEQGPELLQFASPTQVTSNQDSRALFRQAASGGSEPARVPDIRVEAKTYLDGREIGGYVDHRITLHDAETGQALTSGRYV